MTHADGTRELAASHTAELEIRELIHNFVEAIRKRDLPGVMSLFADEVVSFDFGPPLQHGAGDEFARRWEALFNAYPEGLEYEVAELTVVADANLAFSHSLNRIAGVTRDGRSSARWLRWTACFRKVRGRWAAVHEHVSVPTDLRTGRAVLDLAP
jgi:ketosteroid isomerase-like protein